MSMAEFDRGVVFKEQEVIVKHVLCTDGTINTMLMGELVRCKDCKHRDPEDRKCDCGHDIMWQLPRGDDWYCADGERKEGENE